MNRARAFTGLAVLVGVLFACVPTAFAEFTGKGETKEGTTSFAALAVEDGEATLSCVDEESPDTWIVEKGAEHVVKGPKLALKIKTWGTCKAIKGKEAVAAKVTSSECEMETQESKTEAQVSGTVLSTCTLKVVVSGLTCELKIEPKGNEARKMITLSHTGKASENLNLDFAMEAVSIVAAGAGCELAGVKSTATGKIQGEAEATKLTADMAQPEFNLVRGGVGRLSNLTEVRNIAITYLGTGLVQLGNGPFSEMEVLGRNAAGVYFTTTGVLGCLLFMFAPATPTCTYSVKAAMLTGNNQGATYLHYLLSFNNATTTTSVFV